MLRAIVVIPARYAASRFPGKLLAPLIDRPVIQWAWQGATAARLVERVIVAADDERIEAAVRGFGGEVVMTPGDLDSGTDRVAHVARELDCDVIINVQGDEPFVTGTSLDSLVRALEHHDGCAAATLREPLETVGDLFDPNVVKVVTAANGEAIYFSRAPIPYYRTEGNLHADFRPALFSRQDAVQGYFKHVGVYALRREALAEFARTPKTPIERAEGLEQLRLLETGRRMVVVDSDFHSVAIDTIPDLRRATLVAEGAKTP